MFFATGFFSGRIPFAPGTFGTIAAIPFALVLLIIPSSFYGIYITGLILVAIYFADQAEKILGKKDPGCIVIDEIAGYVVTLSMVPVNIYTLVAGFFIFRFFDIVKFGPVRYFEENFSGGAGVVLDDIMAGIFSAVVLRILYLSGIF
ncbi:phosphatidylglycerophosphatase A [Desulfobacula sp.]|uniref:phosphatidylglycerophosphatase A family protein n=1 Tax=Desulfobacula sp. TaxID=2593537 RepID=UPI0025BC020A|nr:phosphatidylglycerophosphatase A [Desulfobacula sp.]